jgi:hypothetical protein
MKERYPLEYILDSGTRVTIRKTGGNTYDFLLKPEEKPESRFTYIDDGRKKSEWDDTLEFEQLEALRKFWLENEEIV